MSQNQKSNGIQFQGESFMYSIRMFLESLVDTVARELAASKMELRNDPTGSRLPDDLWKQCETDARTQLGLDTYYLSESGKR